MFFNTFTQLNSKQFSYVYACACFRSTARTHARTYKCSQQQQRVLTHQPVIFGNFSELRFPFDFCRELAIDRHQDLLRSFIFVVLFLRFNRSSSFGRRNRFIFDEEKTSSFSLFIFTAIEAKSVLKISTRTHPQYK